MICEHCKNQTWVDRWARLKQERENMLNLMKKNEELINENMKLKIKIIDFESICKNEMRKM